MPHLPRAAARADAAPVRPFVLHGVRVGAAEEGRVGDVPSVRAPLPPGPEKLYELGERVRLKLRRAVVRPDNSWAPLSASQQEEMDGAIVMLKEAMDQVSITRVNSLLYTHDCTTTTRPRATS